MSLKTPLKARILKFFVFLSMTFILVPAYCASLSAVGLWQSMDKRTKQPSGIVKIYRDKSGEYFGKIVKIYDQGGNKSTDRCTRCKGDLYNKSILGMVVIQNMKEKRPGFYAQGTILDPKIGKKYRCTLKVMKKGEALKVHGYIGIPLFGRTQVWTRVKISE